MFPKESLCVIARKTLLSNIDMHRCGDVCVPYTLYDKQLPDFERFWLAMQNNNCDMESLVRTIFEGHKIETNLAQKLNDLFARNAARIKSRNTNANSVFERIQEAKGAFDRDAVHALLTPYEKHFEKSSELSIALREKGNELYKSKNVDGALRAYSLSLAFAPVENKAKFFSEELLLAYTNRSAVLLQRNLFAGALADIQRALSILSSDPEYKGIPNLKEKLCERKTKCEQALKTNNEKEDEEILSRNQLFKLENPSKTIPNAESFLEIKYSPERGRHLIARREVEAGSVLLVDQPFVSVLNNLLRWETDHCHNCSRGMVNGIPCQDCSFALFCSDECREIANSPTAGIHHLEHNYLSILHFLDSTHGDIQSLRIVGRVPKKEILEVSKTLLRSASPPTNGMLPGFDNEGTYNVTSYLPIFHLISHPPGGNDGVDQSIINAMKALFLKDLLKSYTSYFDEGKKKKKSADDFEDLIASLILKHLESIKYNAISLSKLLTNKSGKNGTKSVTSYAAAVYPLISLCNHSCDPNCAPVKQSKYLVTSLIALKHLKEGDELFITYKPLYTQMKTSDRQKFLAEGYRFICNCKACEENWGPGMIQQQQQAINQSGYQQGAMLILQPTRCEKCGEGGVTEKKSKQCHECTIKDVGRAKEIQEMEKILFECHDFLLGDGTGGGGAKGIEECLKRLPKIVDYFGREGFQSYFPLYNVALDLYKRALVQSVSQM